MDKLTSECDETTRDMMFRCITDYGYADHVLPDEMQAYMSTGLGKKMEDMNIPNIEEEMEKYKEVFYKYYNNSLYESPIKFNI